MALARVLAASLLLLTAAAPALAQPAAPAPAQAAARGDDYPKGAPRDDYQFTAWCYGALRQHMELYDLVKPELAAISKRLNTEKDDEKSYAAQQAAGRDSMAQMARAMRAAEQASVRPINTVGAQAITQGRAVFANFSTVDKSNQAYAWMTWELPERCEVVSTALENKSLLMGQALKANAKADPAPPAVMKAPVKDADIPDAKSVGLR
ncbi:hypothetical protein BH11PSE2_BH11PSE2_12210 [soil metagenome]